MPKCQVLRASAEVPGVNPSASDSGTSGPRHFRTQAPRDFGTRHFSTQVHPTPRVTRRSAAPGCSATRARTPRRAPPATTTPTETPSAIGSPGVTATSSASANFPSASVRPSPMATPTTVMRPASRSTSRPIARGRRAEGHADTELARASGGRVGHQAIERRRGQQEGRAAQRRGQQRQRPLLHERLGDARLERLQPHRHARVLALQRLSHGADRRRRRLRWSSLRRPGCGSRASRPPGGRGGTRWRAASSWTY